YIDGGGSTTSKSHRSRALQAKRSFIPAANSLRHGIGDMLNTARAAGLRFKLSHPLFIIIRYPLEHACLETDPPASSEWFFARSRRCCRLCINAAKRTANAGTDTHQAWLVPGHQTCCHAHAGKSFLRPLLRNAGRRTRIR